MEGGHATHYVPTIDYNGGEWVGGGRGCDVTVEGGHENHPLLCRVILTGTFPALIHPFFPLSPLLLALSLSAPSPTHLLPPRPSSPCSRRPPVGTIFGTKVAFTALPLTVGTILGTLVAFAALPLSSLSPPFPLTPSFPSYRHPPPSPFLPTCSRHHLSNPVGTIFGTLVAFAALPLRSLGGDGWKIAAALMGRHIGGAVNYVAVTAALQASPLVMTAALAAASLLCALHSHPIPIPLFPTSPFPRFSNFPLPHVLPPTSPLPFFPPTPPSCQLRRRDRQRRYRHHRAVNYVAVTEALQASPSVVTAALAADNLLCALHFTTLFAIAASIPAEGEGKTESSASGAGDAAAAAAAAADAAAAAAAAADAAAAAAAAAADTQASTSQPSFDVSAAATALALAASLCWLGSSLAKRLAFVGGTIPCVTALVLAFATVTPSLAAPLVVPGEKMAALMLQVFFASIGANGNLSAILLSAPSLFLFILLQLSLHLLFTLSLGRLLSLPLKHLLIASNANVGGPTTAAGMAASKGWRSLTVPAILVGIFGYATATFLSVALGHTVLKPMHLRALLS
ncbi:unnamed protein product [Closterium sp. NIES-65]|nr:unnamed protein product [Closterium sp. NIES-65]